MLVITISLLVSVTGLAGVSLIRLQRDEMSTALEVQRARRLARSAVELAHDKLVTASNWRTAFASGTESTPLAPTGFPGTISWRVSDSDGSFSNGDTLLRLDGIGRIGQTTQVISCRFTDNSTVGPTELRSFTSTYLNSDDELKNDKWWGQYHKPSLPGSATSYRITSAQIYCRRINWSKTFNISIYLPNGSNFPSTLVDTTATNSSSISSSWTWHSVSLAGSQWIPAANGVCLTVTTNESSAPIRLMYRSGSAGQSDSAMLGGKPQGWDSYEPNKAILYRVYGEYRTSPPDIEITPGSFYWGAAP